MINCVNLCVRFLTLLLLFLFHFVLMSWARCECVCVCVVISCREMCSIGRLYFIDLDQ